VCLKVYHNYKSDSPMVWCDECDRWIHTGMYYLLMAVWYSYSSFCWKPRLHSWCIGRINVCMNMCTLGKYPNTPVLTLTWGRSLKKVHIPFQNYECSIPNVAVTGRKRTLFCLGRKWVLPLLRVQVSALFAASTSSYANASPLTLGHCLEYARSTGVP